VPFGVGALAYSQAVNDIARIWALLWREAGGDMTGALPLTAGTTPAPPKSAPGAAEKP
jgi:hypothetical protein